MHRSKTRLRAAILLFGTFAMASQVQAEGTSLLDRLSAQDAALTSAPSRNLGATRSLVPQTQPSRGLKAVPNVVPADPTAGTDASIKHATGPYLQFDDELLIEIKVQFGFDSAVLDASEKPPLAEMCTALSQSDFTVRIIGHTDGSGNEAYNLQLSLLRAQEVARYFSTECGISSERLEVMGVGEQVPANADDPLSEENRRVEFQVVS